MDVVYDYYYENYLMLYSLYGKGRPRVSRERFEELDNELLDLINNVNSEQSGEQDDGKARATAARIQEIEYILLDDVAEMLLDKDRRTSETPSGAHPEVPNDSPK